MSHPRHEVEGGEPEAIDPYDFRVSLVGPERAKQPGTPTDIAVMPVVRWAIGSLVVGLILFFLITKLA